MERKVTDKMRRLCSRREYCRSDIRKKLMTELDGDHEAVRRVLDVLVSEKYIDDLRYASAFARDKSVIAGWGEAKIRYHLSSKGLDSDIVSRAMEQVDSSGAQRRLERLIKNKLLSLKDDPQRRLKLIRFAMGRGYGYEQIIGTMNEIEKNEAI